MGELKAEAELFEGRHFDREVIILCPRSLSEGKCWKGRISRRGGSFSTGGLRVRSRLPPPARLAQPRP
jgi:hypothetical protein